MSDERMHNRQALAVLRTLTVGQLEVTAWTALFTLYKNGTATPDDLKVMSRIEAKYEALRQERAVFDLAVAKWLEDFFYHDYFFAVAA